MRPRVSVVVPTSERPEMLDRCLAALTVQDCDPREYEIIVVDDAADGGTRAQVERWTESQGPRGLCVRYLAAGGGHGPAAARNLGWRAARADIVAFTDDDCVPSTRWLRQGTRALAAPVDGVSGRIMVPTPECPTDYERSVANLERSDFVTANCLYRRAAIERVGGFDERFALAWREDTDLLFRLIASGARLVRAPEVVVTHPVRPAPWGISVRQQRKSMFNALLYKKHPRLYRQHIQAAPPWRYYRIVGALAAALSGAIAGHRRWSAGMGCMWALLTWRFCRDRLRGTSRSPRHVVEMLVTSALIPPLAVFWRLRGAWKFRVWFL